MRLNLLRRALLPLWIKIFIWLFLVVGGLTPLIIVLNILGYPTLISLYGLSANTSFDLMGALILALFLYKAVVSYALWAGYQNAVNMALVDATIGVVICVHLNLIYPFYDNDPSTNAVFRLELLLFAPYIFKLIKIRPLWMNIDRFVE